jgi:hypothetical protein
MFESGFFDSTTAVLLDNGFYRGNKAKDAAFMAAFFAAFVDNGVSRADGSFEVSATTGMTVVRKPGQAYINGYMCRDDESAAKVLTSAATAKTVYHVLELDISSGEITEKWLENPGSNFPVRTSSRWQLATAKITVPANAAEIAASNIEDLRADVEWCGTVASAGSVLALKEYVDRIYASINEIPSVGSSGLRPILLTSTDPGAGSKTNEPDGTVTMVYE